MDAIPWGAIVGLLAAGIAFAGFWLARGKSEAKSDAAMIVANQAMAKAEKNQSDLAQARLEMAREYASHETMAKVEDRLAASIERLGDRIDTFLNRTSSK